MSFRPCRDRPRVVIEQFAKTGHIVTWSKTTAPAHHRAVIMTLSPLHLLLISESRLRCVKSYRTREREPEKDVENRPGWNGSD